MAAEGSILGAPAAGGLERGAEPPLAGAEGKPPLPDGPPLAVPRTGPPRGATPRIAPRGPPRGIPRPLGKQSRLCSTCAPSYLEREHAFATSRFRLLRARTWVLQLLVVHLFPFRVHRDPCHPGIHSGSEDPCTCHTHQAPSDKNKVIRQQFTLNRTHTERSTPWEYVRG